MALPTTPKCPRQPLSRPARGPLGVRNGHFLPKLVPKTSPRENAPCALLWKVSFKGTWGGKKPKTHQSNRQVNQLECVHIISFNTHVTHLF